MRDEEHELTGDAATRFADTYLEEIGVDESGWIINYRDPRDGAEWLLDYPHGELHGGGPPRLRRITNEPKPEEPS